MVHKNAIWDQIEWLYNQSGLKTKSSKIEGPQYGGS